MDFGSDDLGDFGPMKPGRKLFSRECKSVLGRLIIGDQSDDVMNHIQSCGPCFMVVFGDGNIMPTSIFDDLAGKNLLDEVKAKSDGRVPPSKEVLEHAFSVTLNEFHSLVNTSTVPSDPAAGPMGLEAKRAPRDAAPSEVGSFVVPIDIVNPMAVSNPHPSSNRGISRRRMIGWVAAAMVVVAGTVTLWDKRSDASRTAVSPTTGLKTSPGRSSALSRWDAYYQGGNLLNVRAQMARSSAKDLRIACEWIAERRITPLYQDMIGLLLDPNITIRRGAFANLARIPAIDLKIHLAAIQSARSLETNPGMQASLDDLIVAIMKA